MTERMNADISFDSQVQNEAKLKKMQGKQNINLFFESVGRTG